MTPGSRAWVVRSLRDWALTVRQGMALVTYQSSDARDLVLDDLTHEFRRTGWTMQTLRCDEGGAGEFISEISASHAEVLFVLDPDRVLFGNYNDRSPFWVNFHREPLVAHPGVQFWWMRPKAATRFGQELPDLSRFFLFREELKDETRGFIDDSAELQPRIERGKIDPNRSRDLLQRALRAAASSRGDAVRVWLELGIPAIEGLLQSGQLDEARTGLLRIESLIGSAGDALERTAQMACQSLQRDSQLERPGDLGRALHSLARIYREIGRRTEAVAAINRVVRVCRQLIEKGEGALLPTLASSLRDQADMLNDVGRREEALRSIEETVAIFRKLAESNPEIFNTALAGALNDQAVVQSEMGRRSEALRSIEDAVGIYRRLAEGNPVDAQPGLASLLNNEAKMQNEMGHRGEALRSILEASEIYRKLAEENPGAYLPALASSLNNLANAQSEIGQRDEGLRSIQQAVEIFHTLANGNPDAFQPALAAALNNQANRQSEMGQRNEALRSITEAVNIRRELAKVNPEVFQAALAGSLNNQANRQSDVGQSSEALRSIEEAVAIYRKLADASSGAFQPPLAASLNNLANRQSELGRLNEALRSIGDAVEIYRYLAKANRDAFLPNLATSLNTLANVQNELGWQTEALQSIGEAVTIWRNLAEINPDAFAPDLARSNGAWGQILADSSPAEAAAKFAEGVSVIAPLASHLPQAYLRLALILCRRYIETCQAAGIEPNPRIEEQVRSLFQLEQENRVLDS